MTRNQGAMIRRELDRHHKGRGKRYPGELRERASAYCRERRLAGRSYKAIASELGLCLETVRRWCLAATDTRRSSALVPVEVVSGPVAPITIVSPSGFRLEGLELDEAVAALRALG
jgi:transposase-like protein